jgi:hypothetical protein
MISKTNRTPARQAPPKAHRSVRIVCISDTHELHRDFALPDGDLLIHAGDFTFWNHAAKIQDFNDWLGELPHRHKVVIPGNHDRAFNQNPQSRAMITNAVLLPETYQWLLVPTQENPQAAVTWPAVRLTGTDALAERASKKLKNDESLLVNFAASRLRMEMDRVPLWRGNAVSIRQLVEDFGRYLYLPRLQTPSILVNAIRSGLALLTWERDAFAYAESFDESKSRYRGLQYGGQFGITEDDTGLLVRPEVARQQIDAETAPPVPAGGVPDSPTGSPTEGGRQAGPGPAIPPQQAKPKRYHGTVALDPARVGRDASRIADEVITHLVGLVGSNVRVSLEIDAEITAGVPDNVVRTVTENSRTLKFESNSGFEKE